MQEIEVTILLRACCLMSMLIAAWAQDYHVDAILGHDADDGTTALRPWQTLARVNAQALAAGDRVLFRSGQIFTAPSDSPALVVIGTGTATVRITYGIYGGTAKAILWQPDKAEHGIVLTSANDGVTIEDLEIAGPFAWSATTAGAESPYGIFLDGTPADAVQGTILQRLVIHDFRGSGIRSNTGDRVADMRIESVEVYQVGDAGIRLGSDFDIQDSELRRNLYVGRCHVHHCSGYGDRVHHGDGIQIACAKDVLVEYCVVHDTGTAMATADGGPVGIWFADVHDGVMQFNESYNNSNGFIGVDGGGIDIDGGCRNCIGQYNYTHDNDGPGMLFAHWGRGTACSPTEGNVFRYNISINDSRASWQGALSFWSADPSHLGGNLAHNNLVVMTRPGDTRPCLGKESGTATGNRVYNNTFVTANGHVFSNVGNSTGFHITGNRFWSLDGNFVFNSGGLAGTDPQGEQTDPAFVEQSMLLAPPTVGCADIERMAELIAAHFRLLDDGHQAGGAARRFLR